MARKIMQKINKTYPFVASIIGLISLCAYASDAAIQSERPSVQEPERSGNILQLRDSLLFTRRVSMDMGFNTASERINAPIVLQDGTLSAIPSSGFANSFSLGVRAPVQRLFNVGISSRWSEASGSSSMRFNSAAVAISKSFNASPTDSFSLVSNYGYSRIGVISTKSVPSLGAAISWFRSLDPVVIGLGFGHQQQIKDIRVNGLRHRQGNSSSLTATMAFAINDQMSLSLTSAASRTGSGVSANINTPSQSAVSTSFSFGYAPTKQDSFFVSSSVASSGGSTSLGLGATYTRRFF